jgi:hypothetical protein
MNMKPATILITAPRKDKDATQHTYIWAQKAIKIAKSLGYNVVVIEKDATTYDNVTQALEKYKPRLYMHLGHGCRVSFNGNRECIVNRKYEISELMNMEPEKLDWLLNPVKLGNSCGKDSCSLQGDTCLPICFNPTNAHLLKDTITIGVACHASSQLGRCIIAMGGSAFVGYRDLLLFPVDDMKSQDIFGQFHIQLMKDVLMGQSVGEAYNNMMNVEDSFIRRNKQVKWLGLPALWDRKHIELLGDPTATIY